MNLGGVNIAQFFIFIYVSHETCGKKGQNMFKGAKGAILNKDYKYTFIKITFPCK
jgi:hypothetical protein